MNVVYYRFGRMSIDRQFIFDLLSKRIYIYPTVYSFQNIQIKIVVT